MKYEDFIKNKMPRVNQRGFEPTFMPDGLFDFQKDIVKKAVNAGQYAIFADCGMGKTRMQIAWAKNVQLKTNRPVLILCPLAVAAQTIEEGEQIGVKITKLGSGDIQIINYDQLKNIDVRQFGGVVLDESSILKNFVGKTKRMLIELFMETEFKLCCTATPAPNDLNEIGNHSEFLNVMDSTDMRMRWFVRENGMSNYRLKGHAENEFYGWVGSWSTVIKKPSDIGHSDAGYDLPPLKMDVIEVETEKRDNGKLYNDDTINATNYHSELRQTQIERIKIAVRLANEHDGQVLIWIKQNEEGNALRKLLPDAVEVRGNDSTDHKESMLLGFAKKEFKILITKTKIAQFGLNFQNCAFQIFTAPDFSFEGVYQAVRRSYRFGQKKPVQIYTILPDTMTNVMGSLQRKHEQFEKLTSEVSGKVNRESFKLKMEYEMKKVKTDQYEIYNADCIDVIRTLDNDSLDLMVFSPPFSNLFTYSDNIRDMGNCADHNEFYEQYKYLISELFRTLRPGRIVAVHTKDLAAYKESSGFSGLYDFTGNNHRLFEEAGFRYHSKVCIWTDPVLERARTNTQRLLYKQVTSDSSYSGVGMPEYVTFFRKWDGIDEKHIPVNFLRKDNYPVESWQKWASPVWMDILRTDVLNDYRGAKDHKDEKHIAPLQLSVIERCIALYSNEGEKVFTPFMGVGSEVYQSVLMRRYGIGVELKESYFSQAHRNIENAARSASQYELMLA
jgi:DNA modification methylase